ncbi:MAG: hypothetical protein SFY69_03630 [Planctomycetota bacterium]|nr:hypothetical protein [Planctomycetota bacterium]
MDAADSHEHRSAGAVTRLTSLLSGLRRAARAQLVLQRAGQIVAALFGAALVVGLIDYAFRLPMALRLLVWAAGLGVAAWWAWRRVVPALLFNPSLTEMALRVERSDAGRRAGLAGVLASGLELGRRPRGGGLTDALATEALARAVEGLGRLPRAGAFLNPRQLRRAMASLAIVGVPIVATSLLAPEFARIGWARVATPWSGAAWPKRTMVVNATPIAAHPLGTPIPLRALLTRTPARVGATDVGVEYRVVADGNEGPWRRALLTSQERRASFDPGAGAPLVEGELFERLLDTGGMGASDAATPAELEFAFETADDRSAVGRVTLVTPPAITGARADITPPAYVGDVLADAPHAGGTHDLGTGRDDRAVLGPVLAGSRVTIVLNLNKPVPGPGGEDLRAWASRAVPGLEHTSDLQGTFDGATWTLSFDAKESMRVPVTLVDSYGIGATDEAVFRVDVLEDRPAMAAVVEPVSDEPVLPDAAVPAAGEGRDDVALAWVRLLYQTARPPAGSEGAPPEAQGEPIELASVRPAQGPATTRERANSTLDLSPLGLAPGDEVWIETEAQDALGASGAREPSRSARRRLRVIGESEFIEQIRAELSGVRESAKRLAGDQERLRGRLDGAKTDPETAADQVGAQGALGERLTPIGDVLRRLTARVERNRLEDESLSGMLRDAQAFVDSAGEKSDRATAALDELSRPGRAERERADAAARGEAAQRGVEEELAALANLLDRGQDSWAVRRQLERLLTEQQQIRSQTRAAGDAVRGRAAEELSRAEREDLERLARRQREAGQRADAIVEALLQRAQAMEAGDAAQAQAMQAAAQRAQQEQLADSQRRAADEIEQNQSGAADELQAQAERAIQRVLDELDRGEARRDEQLRRALAELTESITRLIEAQEREIARLGAVIAGGAPAEPALDAAMATLNQNTLAVQASAREAARGATELIDLLGAAADAQGAAVAALRLPDLAEADGAERLSLSRLREALARAEQMQEEADERSADRRRAELRQAYAEAAETQAALLTRSEPFAGRELSRRDRSEVRGVGNEQAELRERLAQLRSSTEELAEAKVFEFAHQRLDGAMARAAERLRAGAVAAATVRDQQGALRVLQGLVRALTNDQKDDEFRNEEGGGGGDGAGGQGGEQPLIPPLAELKLLRAMQGEAAELTRALDDAPDASPEEVESLVSLQAELARRALVMLEALEKNAEGPSIVPAPDAVPQEPDAPGGAKPPAPAPAPEEDTP